jgi:hypothetical protein
MDNSGDSGVKQVTVENWMKADEASVIWRQMTSVAKTESQWAEFFLGPTLGPQVPKEISRLFEVARSAMMQSWFYYPLATLGMEQCFRLMETGARLRCEAAGIATTKVSKSGKQIDTTFKEKIEAMRLQKIISDAHAQKWEAIRALRNFSSHPSRRSIFDPGQAQGTLVLLVETLKEMFP